jgi:hypothetical protein
MPSCKCHRRSWSRGFCTGQSWNRSQRTQHWPQKQSHCHSSRFRPHESSTAQSPRRHHRGKSLPRTPQHSPSRWLTRSDIQQMWSTERKDLPHRISHRWRPHTRWTSPERSNQRRRNMLHPQRLCGWTARNRSGIPATAVPGLDEWRQRRRAARTALSERSEISSKAANGNFFRAYWLDRYGKFENAARI